MFRNLKALMLASLALAAFGAAGASAESPHFLVDPEPETAITAEKDSHNVVAPNTTAKTSHQVFDIRKSDGTGFRSITCDEVKADDAVIAGATATEITATLTFVGEASSSARKWP